MSKSLNHWLNNIFAYCIAYFLTFFISTIFVNFLLNSFDVNKALEASAFGLLFIGPGYFAFLTIISTIVLLFSEKKLQQREKGFFNKWGICMGIVPILLSLILSLSTAL